MTGGSETGGNYDNGGDLPSGTVLVVNDTGRPEPVFLWPSSTDE